MKKFSTIPVIIKLALGSTILMLINALAVLLIAVLLQKNIALGVSAKDLNDVVERVVSEITIKDQIIQYGEDFKFVNNNVYFLILEDDGMVVSGRYPVNSAVEIGPPINEFRRVSLSAGDYYVYDCAIPGGSANVALWVRGVESVSAADNSARFLFSLLKVIAPVFVILTAIISVVLAKRSLKPLEESYNRQKQLTSNISHELRTPISVINAQCDYLNNYADNIDEYKDGITLIHKQADKMNGITNSLLTLSRLEQNHDFSGFIEVSSSDYINDLINDFKASHPDVILDLNADTNVTIFIHKELFSVAIENILENVKKYGASKAKISISSQKNILTINIRDFGGGIEDSDIPHIFDTFYRGDSIHRNNEGSGLGLALTKRIVDIHSGIISAYNHPDGGVVFSIQIALRG